MPEHWVCGMMGEKCGVGGHDFMSNRDLLDVKVNQPCLAHVYTIAFAILIFAMIFRQIKTQFTCGSMVWAKLKGFPWWPGMIDYCPDSQARILFES